MYSFLVLSQTQCRLAFQHGLKLLGHLDQLLDDLGRFYRAVVILAQGLQQAVAVLLLLHYVIARSCLDFVA